MLSIISEEAGVDLKDLGPSADFADYGIDSLLSLNITGRMKEELGLDFPSSVFADYPTVKELTAFVDAGNSPAPSSASSSEFERVEAIDLGSSSEDDLDGYETSVSSVDEGIDVIKIIRATIAEETGIDLAELTDSTSFAELGIDSLLALNVTGKLSELLDIPFSQSLLADNDTLSELQSALNQKPQIRTKALTAPSPSPDLDNPVVTAPPHATSVLLQGNPKTAIKKLFLFPDGSGSATSCTSPLPFSFLPEILANQSSFR